MGQAPIDRVSFEAATLLREHPPQWPSGNKQLVFDIACSSNFPFEGQVAYARWPKQELPDSVTSESAFSVRSGVFAYADPKKSEIVPWHLNFSDPYLFVAYDSHLLAQDELQVSEHPILGAVREALLSKGMAAVTVNEREEPTPVTITGVQRRCFIDTQPNPTAGLPSGLYGDAFSMATAEQVKAATNPLSPPTMSNILAISAPPGGWGEYSREEMLDGLTTAYAGFSAARQESKRLVPDSSRTVIHTGFWGCGAFGGNRRLMTILQALAADLADVEIVFWAFDESRVKLARDAHQVYERLRDSTPTVDHFLGLLLQEKFEWGVSDGN
jgi:hypothetical protein